MPGTAKMIWTSWAASHGPNQPCAPNSSTKTRPEITGDTENGRSIRVTSKFLPRKLEFGDRPGRREPEDRVQRHDDRGDQQGQRDRGARVRIGERREVAVEALARTPRRTTTTSGSSRNRREKADAPARSAASARRSFVRDGRGGTARGQRDSATTEAPRVQACSSVDRQQHDERDRQHDRGDRRRAGVVEFLELDDDQQRRDFGDASACCRR